MTSKEAPSRLRDQGNRILVAGFVLAILYFGRSVLIPLALALMLSLLITPLVRVLRRIRVGRTTSVFLAVAAIAVSGMAVTTLIGMQVVRIAASLPQYESNIQHKLRRLEDVTVGPLMRLTDEASHLTAISEPAGARPGAVRELDRFMPTAAPGEVVPQQTEFESHPLLLLGKVLPTVWRPVQFMGIVILVLIFVLLELESLRDRFIRIAAATDIRAATIALNDAGERLSRYFVSQFLVNLAFGVAIWISLSALGVAQALLCAILAGVMRFVPYVGVSMVALFASVLALAVGPGWTAAVGTVGVFVLLDILVGQFVEPHLYGHATGLSPLAVVVGAIFWSALWGPTGLILSTPLTLCLLLGGRHLKGLKALEVLLGSAQPLTLPQRFYQRALASDPHEIIADARDFLRRRPLAQYFDQVMIPALHLARLDVAAGTTTSEQQLKLQRVVVDVAAALTGTGFGFLRRRHRGAVLDELNAGSWLRLQRERLTGKYQGPLGVPAGSIVICMGLGAPADDLAAELLVRALRGERLDARHFAPTDMAAGLPPEADPAGVAIVFIVSAFPNPERQQFEAITQQLQALLPQAQLIRVFCPGLAVMSESIESRIAGPAAGSLGEAVRICTAWQSQHSPVGRGAENSRAKPLNVECGT